MALPYYGFATTASGGATISDHAELTAAASGAVELAEARLGPSSAATGAERVFLQRKSATMTGTAQTPRALNTRSPAKAGTYKDTCTVIGTATGTPLVMLLTGRPNDEYGGWSAPRPNARIIAVNSEIVGLIQSIGSGHTIIESYRLSESGIPSAGGNVRRIARRTTERGYWSSQVRPYFKVWWSGPVSTPKLADVRCQALTSHPDTFRYRRSWNVLFDTGTGTSLTQTDQGTATSAGVALSTLTVTLTAATAAAAAAGLSPAAQAILTAAVSGASGTGLAAGNPLVTLTAAVATATAAGQSPGLAVTIQVGSVGTATAAGLPATFTGPGVLAQSDQGAASAAGLPPTFTVTLSAATGTATGAGAAPSGRVSLSCATGSAGAAGLSASLTASLTAATGQAAGAGVAPANPKASLTAAVGTSAATGVSPTMRVTLTAATGTAAANSPLAAAARVAFTPLPGTTSSSGLSLGTVALRNTIGAPGTMTGAGLPAILATGHVAQQYGGIDADTTPAGVRSRAGQGTIDGRQTRGIDSYTPRGIDGD